MLDKDHKPERRGTKRNNLRGTALGPQARVRFKQARRGASLTTAELAANARVSEKVITNIENLASRRSRFDDATLTKIARALGKNPDELVWGKAVKAALQPEPRRFDRLERLSQDLDEGLIPLIRDVRSAALASKAHSDLLRERIRRSGSTLDQHLELLNDRDLGGALLASLPKVDVSVEADEKFKRLSFRFGRARINIASPSLLWDCGCTTPSSSDSLKKCPIHKHAGASELAARFNGGHVAIWFRGAQYRWRSHRALWPPSFDSFAMYMDLERAGVLSQRLAGVLDLGCGTGFLGIGVTLANPNIVHLTLADWLLTPLLYSRVNWFLNQGERAHVDVHVRLGLFTNWLEPTERSYDLLVCNPPYLPLLDGFDELGLESTVAGTELLEHVIQHGCSIARQVYVQFSDLADAVARESAQKVGVRLVPVGPSHDVPFRIPLVWKHKKYIETLISHCGLRHRPRDRHPYWHRIRTYRVES